MIYIITNSTFTAVFVDTHVNKTYLATNNNVPKQNALTKIV